MSDGAPPRPTGWIRHVLALLIGVLSASPAAFAQTGGQPHALLIGGLGGDASYSDQFSRYLNDTRTLLVDRHGFPEANVTVLAEQAVSTSPFVDDVSTAENVRAAFEDLAERLTPDDRLFVVLFGHGSYDGSNASLNIPRRDLIDADYASLLDAVDAGRIVFINTASASGPFAAALSGAGRIIITATASGNERDATVFPTFLVEALGAPEADLDKDGGISARELFEYASARASRSFEETGHIVTEHAQIEDDGDGQPTRADAMDSGTDGDLAGLTHLRRPEMISSANLPLARERQDLERRIAEMKRQKSTLGDDAYYAQLEVLFVELARLNARIESAEP